MIMQKILFILPFLALTGCGEGQTKAWYLEHHAAREKRVLECRNDAKLQVTPDCQNAMAANAELFVFGGQRNSGKGVDDGQSTKKGGGGAGS